jgi:hypothetical protein
MVSIMIDRDELQELFDEDDRLAAEFEQWERQQEKMKKRSAPRMVYKTQEDALLDEPEPVEAFTQLQIDAIAFTISELRAEWRSEMKREIAVVEAKFGSELALLRKEAEFLRGLVQGTIVEMRRKPDAA